MLNDSLSESCFFKKSLGTGCGQLYYVGDPGRAADGFERPAGPWFSVHSGNGEQGGNAGTIPLSEGRKSCFYHFVYRNQTLMKNSRT